MTTRFPDTLALGLWAAVGFAAVVPSRAVYSDGDPLAHAAIGRAIWAAGGLPATDPFVAGAPAFRDHEWLADVLWYAIASALGPAALAVVAVGLAAGTVGVVAAHVRRVSSGLVAFLVIGLVADALLLHLQARPHLFTWLFVVAGRLALASARPRASALAGWAALGVLWGNLHGGFLPGAALLGAAALQEELRRGENAARAAGWGAAVALSVAAGALVNPVGPALHADVLAFLRDGEVLAQTLDFLPPWPGTPAFPAFLALVVAAVAAFASDGRRRSALDLAWVAGGVALAATSGRNIPLVALFLAPELAAWGHAALGEADPSEDDLRGAVARVGRRLEGVATMRSAGIAAVLLGGIGIAWGARGLDERSGGVPVDGLAALCGSGGGTAFTAFHWGGYVAWDCPTRPVYLHPLTANYEGAGPRMTAYGRIVAAGAGWEPALREIGATHVLLPPEDPLAVAIRDRGWPSLHRDGASELFAVP